MHKTISFMFRRKTIVFITILFVASVVGILIAAVYDNTILKQDLNYWQLLYAKQLEESKGGPFTDSELNLPKNNKFNEYRDKYIAEKKNFITIDLREMELIIYKDGEEFKKVPVASKGEEGSFRETPSGNYYVMLKTGNKLSSVSKVWMPWSIQFYGNYFLHGMPYYPNGNLVKTKYSWGCIRLADINAKEVYNFVEIGTPILISDDIDPLFTKKPINISESIKVPDVSAQSFSIFNFSSDEQILEKDENEILPIGYLTKLFTSLTASEVTNLDNYIYFEGKKYAAVDLLPIMFGESSNSDSASKTIISMLGNNLFMKNVLIKRDALMLADTQINELYGNTELNTSTASDLMKLLRYILEKRKSVSELTRKNFNSEYSKQNGFQGGIITNNKTNSLTAWKLRNKDGEDFIIGISILKSIDSYYDTVQLLDWFNKSYDMEAVK